MKFIYFINAALKEKVLDQGLVLTPNQRKINSESTGIFCYPMIKIPFKCPVTEKDYKDINDYLEFKNEENLLNNSLSVEEAWEVVGASRVKRRDPSAKEVAGVIFELDSKHWPIIVFIDVRHFFANELAKSVEAYSNKGISYNSGKSYLSEVVKKIESPKYVICNAPFTVNSEEDLLKLINFFMLSGGGIWKEDSFECMLTYPVSNKNIKQIIQLENKYYNLIRK